MKEKITIYFQTSSEIRNTLEKIAEEEHQTVSSIIEAIIYQYFKANREGTDIFPNRRRLERKKVSIPAHIGDARWHRREFVKGTLMDISGGGMRLSLPKGTKMAILNENKTIEYSVIFNVPNYLWPIKMKCRLQRVVESGDEVQIGAVSEKQDFYTYNALQKYLSDANSTATSHELCPQTWESLPDSFYNQPIKVVMDFGERVASHSESRSRLKGFFADLRLHMAGKERIRTSPLPEGVDKTFENFSHVPMNEKISSR